MPEGDFQSRDYTNYFQQPTFSFSDEATLKNLSNIKTPETLETETSALGIVAEEETKAPPLVAVAKKSASETQFRVLLDQVEKTSDPEEKAQLVRSAMELIGKQSDKVVQLIQTEQGTIQKRKDSTDEADAIFKLAATAAETKFTSALATTIASSPDTVATGVVLSLRLAEIGKVRALVQAKRDELASLQETLAKHPNDETLKAKVQSLNVEIEKLSADATEKARSVGMDSVKFCASSISMLVGDVVKTATSQSLSLLAGSTASNLIDIVVLLDGLVTKFQELKKVTGQKEALSKEIETLKNSGGNESLIIALEVKLAYLENMKRTVLIATMVRDAVSAIGKAEGIAQFVAQMLAAKVAVVLAKIATPITVATIGISVAILLETGLTAEIEAAMKKGLVKWEESIKPKISSSPTSHYQELSSAMKEQSSTLRVTKQKLEKAYSKETELNQRVSSLQSRLQNQKLSASKKREIVEELAKTQVEANKAKVATDQAKEAHNRVIQQMSVDDLAGISKVAKVASRLSMTEKEKIEEIEETRQRKVEAASLGQTVEQMNEYRAVLRNEVLADPKNYDAFKKYFQEHQKETGISPETFRDEPMEAVMMFLFS